MNPIILTTTDLSGNQVETKMVEIAIRSRESNFVFHSHPKSARSAFVL